MKRIITIIALISILITGVLVLTGCNDNGTANESTLHKISFVDLKYDEVRNFSRKDNTVDWENYKVLNYFFTEDDNKSIKLIWYKEKNESVVIDEHNQYEEKTINSINWKVIRSTDFGVTYDTYCTEHNGDVYVVELNGVDKYQQEFDEFMKTVEF